LNRHVGIIRVSCPVEKDDEFKRFQFFGDTIEGGASFLGGVEVLEFLGEFDTRVEVCEVFLEFEKGKQFGFKAIGIAENRAGFLLIVPEFRVGCLTLKVRDLLGEGGDVKDTS
jgi:hypothetical protein